MKTVKLVTCSIPLATNFLLGSLSFNRIKVKKVSRVDVMDGSFLLVLCLRRRWLAQSQYSLLVLVMTCCVCWWLAFLLTSNTSYIAYIAMLMHILGTIIIMLRVHNVCHMKTRHKGLFLPKSRYFAFWPFRLYLKNNKEWCAWRIEPTISRHLTALTNYYTTSRATLVRFFGEILLLNKSYAIDDRIVSAPGFFIKKRSFFKKWSLNALLVQVAFFK